jgi:hypothetical protein
VIKSLSNYDIIPFNKMDANDLEVLQMLIEVVKYTGIHINKEGIKSARPNEVGNYIEPHIKESFKRFDLYADTPKTSRGNKKSTGYPDIEFRDKKGNYHYLECKTYNIENIDTTQRSFYLSPSEEFKITRSAHHFMISFETYRSNGNLFKVKHWKILTLENLLVDIKNEFNADNRRLYREENTLAEGIL